MDNHQTEVTGSSVLEMEDLRIISKSSLSVEDVIRIKKENETDKAKRLLQDQYARYFGYHRQLRVECQNLIASFKELKSKYSEKDADACKVNTIPAHLSVYQHNKKQIHDLIKSIREIVKNNPTIHTQSGEKITEIENIWAWVEEIYPELENPQGNIVPALEQCITHLCDITYECGIVTIPPRMKDHLKTLRPGYSLSFYKTFKDELCTKEQSDRILKYLAEHPGYFDGIVDLKNGVIYKAEPERNRKWSYLRIAGAILAGCVITTVILLLLKNSGQFPGLSVFSDVWQIPLLYTVLIGGGVVHIVIDAFKDMKSESSSLRAVEDWFLWIHIKESQILKGIIIIWFGFVFLALVFPKDLNYVTAFVAGYSIDSLGDLFIDRFETIMAEQSSALKKTISA